jgi:hypothetical protein
VRFGRGPVVQRLTRLPVTEEIAGSIPVGPAKKSVRLMSCAFLVENPIETLTGYGEAAVR